jgi:hypothetical protein
MNRRPCRRDKGLMLLPESENHLGRLITVSLLAGPFAAGDFRVGPVLNRAWSMLSGNFLTRAVSHRPETETA